ncbi:glutathione S-transferase N-terminal domain-containing protein, partial [Acinetobacter nosocomialis]|nr:glutathione S-transferase N-terminal domain-containing protein [Acinetobacter nosocomialis]
MVKNEQQSEDYLKLNRSALVPTLVDGDLTLSQSLSILEYLDEQYPETKLLPNDVKERAKIRAFAQAIACDIHPLNNLRDQTERYLAGKLSEDEYRPLRLQNGLYVQRYAPMLRIAVPYGLMNSKQLRKVAEVSTKYDRGYAHVSTRQNIQLNWPALEDVPDILAELATVQMHAIQTSGQEANKTGKFIFLLHSCGFVLSI